MQTRLEPEFRNLDRSEIDQILTRTRVGRLAFSREGRVDIRPVHYIYDGGWIYGRTSAGSMLGALGDEWHPVAFEVDEVEGLFDWRSVVIHGGFHPLHRDGAHWRQAEWMRALGLLRQLLPETLRQDDPVPQRDVLFRIAVQTVNGRAASFLDPQREES